MDWDNNIEGRNYGIQCKSDSHNLLDLLCISSSILVIAGILIFHSWSRSQIVNMGYEIHQLRLTEEEVLQMEKQLILEHQMLQDPARIDEIARHELGMAPARPHQILPQSPRPFELHESDVVTLIGVSQSGADLRRASSTND